MSTLFGVFSRAGNTIESSTVKSMEEALSYTETDKKIVWKRECIVLGHHMVQNTPESQCEHFPLKRENCVLTMDARIDNRETLFTELTLPDRPMNEIGDSEFILAAYLKWGVECPKYLLGDFVFVIWDKDKKELFCARDQIGIKPFYYYLDDDVFVFSNDIRGVLSYPEIPTTYNDKSLAMFLSGDFGFYHPQETCYRSIQKLPAATSMTICKESVSQNVYWQVEEIQPVTYDREEEYVQVFQELLEDAVKVRLRTVYPVGSHLSGGLDSTAIGVLAARMLKKEDQKLFAFNWVKTAKEDNSKQPEWSHAQEIAHLEEMCQIPINLEADYLASLYDKVDITTDDISFYWEEYVVREEAQKRNIRTILSGWGGDELISNGGYAYLSGLFYQGHFFKAIKEIYSIYKYEEKSYIWLRTIKRAMREIVYPFFYKRMSGWYKPLSFEADPFEYAQIDFAGFCSQYKFDTPVFHPGVHAEQKMLFEDGHLLQRIEYWAASALEKNVEYRYPLLDKRIVEFALGIPEDLFGLRKGHRRYFFRSAISKFLPEHIAWEAKMSEKEHMKRWLILWDETLRVWIEKNKNTDTSKNMYMDRKKMIEDIKTYYSPHRKEVEKSVSRIVASILMSNIKNVD